MTSDQISTKAELLISMESAWQDLNKSLNSLTDTQMTTRHDAHGWSIKDHIIHLMTWELSTVYFLVHMPRHVALGIEKTLLTNGTDDEINEKIFQQTRGLSLKDAVDQSLHIHQKLVDLIKQLTQKNLQMACRSYFSEGNFGEDDISTIDFILGNSTRHYEEHLTSIKAIVDKENNS